MSGPRVALVCTGAGYVNRGFERVAQDLFAELDGRIDITLFKGAGVRSEHEIPVRVPRRSGRHARLIGAQRAYELELVFFAARIVTQLRKRYDVVHYLEPYLGNVLASARRRIGGDFTLLLTDALGLTRRSSSRADLVHVMTPADRALLVAEGRPADEVIAIPLGTETRRFADGPSREQARRMLGLPLDRQVILDVAAVNRRHKRMDVLIDEVECLDHEPWLLVSGSLEEPDILTYGRQRLGERFLFADVASEETPILYAAADLFAHTALEEGFGLAIVEAMAAGLPVVINRSPHFEWLVGDERQLVDFRQPGALAEGIKTSPADAPDRNRARASELDWKQLAPSYLELYEIAASRAR